MAMEVRTICLALSIVDDVVSGHALRPPQRRLHVSAIRGHISDRS